MTLFACLIWNMFIFGGTGYLIAVHDWSAWWILVPLFTHTWPEKTKT